MPLTNKSPGLCWGALDACWGPAVYTQADSFQFHLNLHSLFLQRLKISQMWDLRNFLGLFWANAEPWVCTQPYTHLRPFRVPGICQFSSPLWTSHLQLSFKFLFLSTYLPPQGTAMFKITLIVFDKHQSGKRLFTDWASSESGQINTKFAGGIFQEPTRWVK